MNAEGLGRLAARLDGRDLSSVVGDEATIMETLAALEHTNLSEFSGARNSVRASRAAIRYLAALWPDATMKELTDRIFTLVNNRHLLPDDVQRILEGVSLGQRALSPSDVRVMLDGKNLSNPTVRTNEVPIQVIQLIGKCLREGYQYRETARIARCSFDTVAAVDRLLGLREVFLDKQFDRAANAVRDGLSVRSFALLEGMSRSAAQRLMVKARNVLTEIGEL